MAGTSLVGGSRRRHLATYRPRMIAHLTARRRPHPLEMAIVAILSASIAGCGPAVLPPSPSGSAEGAAPTPPAATSVSASPGSAAASTALPTVPSGRPLPQTSRLRPPLPSAALQRRLDAIRARRGIPGMAVTIRWLDGEEWTGTTGVADATTDVPVTRDTAFALGSVSKTYTAAVGLLLVESGRLDLDAPVATLLPDLLLDPRITVRMLFDHTSGLADYFLDPRIDPALQGDPDAAWDLRRSFRYVRDPVAAPGEAFFYSNTNYLLLGELIEVVTGEPLAAVVRERLLEPLGLAETWTQVDERPLVPTARGHRVRGSRTAPQVRVVGSPDGLMPFRSVLTAAGGAGAMASTSRDAARWIEALAGRDVLGRATRAAMRADALATAALGARIPYGLGIQVERLLGREAVGHTGRLLGFRSFVRYLPDEGISIAILMNENGVDPAPIARSLLRLVLPARPDCPTCPEVR